IAMTAHGRSGQERRTRGSVAERLLRHARCPVLLANPWGLAATGVPFQRILVPFDASELSARALELAVALGRLFDSELVIFHAFGWPEGADNEREARELVEAVAKPLSHARVVVTACEGDPARAILRAAEHEGADLVAMSSHGRSGASRWAYGSTAEHVLRECRAPLLLVPAEGRVEVEVGAGAAATPAIAPRVSER
ncbi:universal stress protein, partial [bacterium]|nr:universal stress protein [bacterium]